MNKLDLIKKECSKSNWNLYDAKPISNKLIREAKRVMRNFDITPEVFPTGRSTIQFEFEYMNVYLEFELIRISKRKFILEWFRIVNNKEEEGVISSRDYNKMNNIVYDTFGGLEFIHRR